ncbi:MAG TPA: ABC transporter permease [Gaiellaceae bacterium]|nr:ABC transporter permease [Gaiellaceae bacterium]
MSTAPTHLPTPPAAETAVRKALATGTRPARASTLSTVLAFGWRGMLKIKHVPEQLLDVTLTPVLIVFLFTYMFGGAIAGSTGDYLQFLLPGMLVMSLLFSTIYSGVALNTDATTGVVDRFRSLPISRPSPLIGAVLGDSVRYLIGASVIVALGVALGYRPEAGFPGVLMAVALVVAFAFGLSWLFGAIGLLMRAPRAVSAAGNMALFPLVFLSNVFVEPDTLPGWLETVVNVSPISHLVTAARGLMDGTFAGLELTFSLGTAAVLTAVFVPLTTYLYGRK